MYYMVWKPRYRYKILVKGVDEYFLKIMYELRKDYPVPEIEFVQKNIQPDQVHLVLSFPPKYSIAKVVQIIKSNTGKAIWEKFDFLRQRYYGRGGICSAGCFVSTVGLDEKLIERYVQYQEKEDLGQAKLALD